MSRAYPMTAIGKKKLEEELAYLKEEKLKEVNDEVKYLRGFCDFSEDVSFNKMLEEQFLVKDRINIIEEMLLNSEVINSNDEESNIVLIGTTVTFIEMPDGDEETYTIVGSTDSNPMEDKISIDSPIGKSLLGSKINDIIPIETPSGGIKVKIIDIS